MAKMRKPASTGKCELCGGEFTKSAIKRHLAKCLSQADVDSPGKGKLREIFELKIEDRYCPDYWLYVETAASSHFAALDDFLRHLWLECCGHCSAFNLPQPKQMATARGKDLFAELVAAFENADTMMRNEQALMGAKLCNKVTIGDKFDYEYDFGSSTELRLEVVGKRDGNQRPGKVRLLARNLPPDIRCTCGAPAIHVCTDCSWEPTGWLCEACGNKHDCGDEMFLPVVNSPRVGVCGYCGPED